MTREWQAIEGGPLIRRWDSSAINRSPGCEVVDEPAPHAGCPRGDPALRCLHPISAWGWRFKLPMVRCIALAILRIILKLFVVKHNMDRW